MGEFQGYKFQTVDKPLTSKERQDIASLSSRSKVSSNAATFVYHYGDFHGDPAMLLANHFDLHLYFTNWGTKQLMLKFPKDLVNVSELQQYSIDYSDYSTSAISLHTHKDFVVLDLEWHEENGEQWVEIDDYDLADFISIREDIIDGDYSGLFLFWLHLASFGTYTEHELEGNNEDIESNIQTPPIPLKLANKLNTLAPFIDFFGINNDLVAAVMLATKSIPQEDVIIDYQQLIQKMSISEKDTFLIKLLEGETRVDIQLKKYLDAFTSTPQPSSKKMTLRDILDLKQKATDIRKKEEKKEANRLHLLKMKKLEKEKEQTLKSIFFNLNRKTGKSYDLATSMLVDLKELAIYQNDLTAFNHQINTIKEKYGRSKILIRRLEDAGL